MVQEGHLKNNIYVKKEKFHYLIDHYEDMIIVKIFDINWIK